MKMLYVSSMLCLLAQTALAADNFALKIEGIEAGKSISPEFAYCAPEQKAGANFRPALTWEHVPSEAKSLAIVVVDPDVPTDFSDAGKEGKIIPAEMKRQNFYHWIAYNIPTEVARIPAGKGSGKEKSASPVGAEWVNDYAAFHPDAPLSHFTGYDGPCPPWNDARLHHYHFQLHALDVEVLKPAAKASAAEVARLIQQHSIAQAEIMATYTLNMEVKK